MSQAIPGTIDPLVTSGTQLTNYINDFIAAAVSGFKGPSRPTNLQVGGYWVDDLLEPSPDFLWKYKMWDGTDDIEIFRVNISANSITFVGSTSVVTGSRGTPISVTVAGITPAGVSEERIFVKGSGGPINVTANPRIAAGTAVGQILKLVGRSDTDTLTLANGNGLSLNGDITLLADDVIVLFWDGTNWTEETRRR